MFLIMRTNQKFEEPTITERRLKEDANKNQKNIVKTIELKKRMLFRLMKKGLK